MGVLPFVLGVSLSMDALVVSCAIPLCVSGISIAKSLKVAASFGFFQALMPLLGWLVAKRFLSVIAPVDHWIGLFLLSLVGGRMIKEGLSAGNGCPVVSGDPTGGRNLLALSVGTSIDALAAGISFTGMDMDVLPAVVIIGIITFIISFSGLRFSSSMLGNNRTGRMEIAGGVVLILIGIHMVLDHLGVMDLIFRAL